MGTVAGPAELEMSCTSTSVATSARRALSLPGTRSGSWSELLLLDTGGDVGDLLDAGGDGDQVPGREDLRRFSELLSHTQDFLRSKQKTEDMKLLYDETEEFLGPDIPPFNTFIEVLGRLYINGFEICDSDMETYGWGVFLGPRYLKYLLEG